MKTPSFERPREFRHGRSIGRLRACVTLLLFGMMAQVSPAFAQPVLFDFDNLPVHTPFPVSQTVGGLTANFSGTGQGYSIQAANTMGFTPPGFSGNCIYPSSIYLSDLLIRYDQPLTDFSIMYSVQELACDTSATMRVTAYRNGSFVGTNTKVATVPGTWPVDTLKCSFPQGFDSVVVHYDSHPPACQDYGVIYMADNMRVTLLVPTGISETGNERPEMFALRQNYPNPFNPNTTIGYYLPVRSSVTITLFDLLGREVATPVHGVEEPGQKSVRFNAADLVSGVYYYRLRAGTFVETKKLVLLR
jgi:hypothetical protein